MPPVTDPLNCDTRQAIQNGTFQYEQAMNIEMDKVPMGCKVLWQTLLRAGMAEI